jgi:hypothetical protein
MGVHSGPGMDLLWHLELTDGKGETRTLDPGIVTWSADQYATEIRKIRVHLFRCGSLPPSFHGRGLAWLVHELAQYPYCPRCRSGSIRTRLRR